MNPLDFGFLSTAFQLTLDRRRLVAQLIGVGAALLVLECAAQIARVAQVPAGMGRLLAFPLFYVLLTAAGVVVCASCRHTLSAGPEAGPREPFRPLDALARHALPALTGASLLFLAAGAAVLVAGLVVALGKVHPAVLGGLSVLFIPLTLLLGAAVAVLALGLLLVPPLAAAGGGDLDGLLAQAWQILRTRFFRLLCQQLVALALAALFTALIAVLLVLGWGLLDALGERCFGREMFDNVVDAGVTGFLFRLESWILASAVLTPALVFLNASATLLCAGSPSSLRSPLREDDEEEGWLQP